MTPSPARDLLVGVFLLLALGALAYLSLPLGGLRLASDDSVELFATFDQIGGLKPRAKVVIGGVKVGQVAGIELADDYRARVRMEVSPELELPSDSSAAILTSGVLGDQYIELEPGGLDDTIAPGGEIEYTQSAVVLERMLGRFLQNLGEGQASEAGEAGAGEAQK